MRATGRRDRMPLSQVRAGSAWRHTLRRIHPEQERDMTDTVTERIRANPKYQELRRKRNAFGWLLAVCMLVVYYGYISLIAFNKEFLSLPLGSGVTTIGVPIGMGVIVFTIVITGIYVRRANSEFDALTRQILEEEAK
jgi:uncharacterized membrane protein (DUF485 family)